MTIVGPAGIQDGALGPLSATFLNPNFRFTSCAQNDHDLGAKSYKQKLCASNESVER